jgi:hypothetical protein
MGGGQYRRHRLLGSTSIKFCVPFITSSTCKYGRFQKQKHSHNRFQRTGHEAKKEDAAKRFGAQELLLLMKDDEVDGSTFYLNVQASILWNAHPYRTHPAFCGGLFEEN